MTTAVEWISSKEAAELLGVSRVTVWRMANSGKLRRLGVFNRRSVFDKNEILIEAAKRRIVADGKAA
jgi:excisionase family DNA binding protein